jgi:Mrp family chromosome partitioning ATPase
MKIKLLIATSDTDYTAHLSDVLAQKYADTFEVAVCSSVERLSGLLAVHRFDAALLEEAFIAGVNLAAIHVPLLLWDETEVTAVQTPAMQKIRKYQQISAIAGDILTACAQASVGAAGSGANKAYITAVWSPAGGVGKTTVALAYAAGKAAEGKQVLYLNLEHFSSTPLYFAETGRSISALFDKLSSNAGMLARAIWHQDSGTGVRYFCMPENYDDINILSQEDIIALLDACSGTVDELVIDLPCLCDQRIRQIFECAHRVMLVSDTTKTAQTKLRQFIQQHNVFEHLRNKAVLIANKGAMISEPLINAVISLPLVPASEEHTVYKTLSANRFEV